PRARDMTGCHRRPACRSMPSARASSARPRASECWPLRPEDAECRIRTLPPPSGLTGAKSGSVSRARVLKSDSVALSVLSVAGWHLEVVTTQEPGTAAEPTTTAEEHDTAVDSTPPSGRQ